MTHILYLLLITALTFTINGCVPAVTSTPQSTTVQINNTPQVNQVIAPAVINIMAPAEITCKASDADNDLLAYYWNANTGNITGSGATVVWIAPPVPGTYLITVVVSDGRGGQANKSIRIEVLNPENKPPKISRMLITKMDKTELTVLPGDARPILTRPWNVISIECLAEDPEKTELSYEWKSAGGKIEGDGRIIKFVPVEKEEIVLSVTVKDRGGASSIMDIHFYADCCGHYPSGAREY